MPAERFACQYKNRLFFGFMTVWLEGKFSLELLKRPCAGKPAESSTISAYFRDIAVMSLLLLGETWPSNQAPRGDL